MACLFFCNHINHECDDGVDDDNDDDNGDDGNDDDDDDDNDDANDDDDDDNGTGFGFPASFLDNSVCQLSKVGDSGQKGTTHLVALKW